MASILTNNAAIAALQTLRTISDSMAQTQNRIAGGARVSSAADNAAYWAISTTMKSDVSALSSVSDALGMGAAKIDTAYAGMEAAIKVVEKIKAKVVASKEEGVDRAKIQEEIAQLQDQLKSIGVGSSFNGENFLVGAAADKTVVSGFVRDSSGNVMVKSTTYAMTAEDNILFDLDDEGVHTEGSGILAATGETFSVDGEDYDQVAVLDIDVTADDADIDAVLLSVEWALDKMTDAGAKLGSLSSRVELQEDFAKKLTDALNKGVGRLVDADMNEESTRLKALQTQQQLAIQALSIANSDSQNILSLFR